MKKSSYRFYEIDFLRFLAALFVVMFHYTFRGYAADHKSVLFFPYFGEISRYGYLGVPLFFIISGFVILLSAYNKKSMEFAISRFVRLYPAYWFAVTLTFVTILAIGGVRYKAGLYQYIVNMTMLHSYVGVASIDGVYWTLMVEVKFYLLIFIIIFMNQIHNIKYYLGIWLASSVVLTYYHVSYVSLFLIPEWSSYFIAGACFYLIYKEGASLYTIFMIAVSFVMSNHYAFLDIPEFYRHYNVELHRLVMLLVIASFYGIFFLIALQKTHLVNSRKFITLGVLTYPLYLIHQNIGFMFFNFFHKYGLNKYLILLVVLAMMLFAAYIINSQIEKKYSGPLSRYLLKMRGILSGEVPLANERSEGLIKKR